MKAGHLALLCVDGKVNVAFEGRKEGAELLDGVLLAGERPVGQVRGGVASFVAQDQWPQEKTEKLRQSGFTLRKLRDPQFADDVRHEPLVNALLHADGPVLEIAAGPSGGHFPLLLRHRPDTDLLVNDISPGILGLWRDSLDAQGAGPNVSLVAFDATAMPLRDGHFAGISSVLGFGSVSPCQKAIREAHRVLRHGGVLCATELVMSANTVEQMPTSVRDSWMERIPITQLGLRAYLENEGFLVETYRRDYLRDGDPAEDPPAKVAAEHGLTLRWESEWIVARKCHS
ncbi:MAG: class I SAM-dependent methyltransferase [Phycisphaerae bacterium]|nr:class I SAM-dependent methyltransferase [Phycisphaerae bacterium]